MSLTLLDVQDKQKMSWKKNLEEYGYGRILTQESLTGGCINESFRLEMETGQSLFLKSRSRCPVDFFEAEAEGLRYLQVAGSVRVPEIILVGPDYLILEYISPSKPRADFWSLLARQLAALHSRTASCFGFINDNYCGATPQINSYVNDGYQFYGEHRFLYQGKRARDKNLLDAKDIDRLERLVKKLPNLIPCQRPSLIHGDLWSGNVHCDSQGGPVLIDPAVYYGWPEAELAMTMLFGAFPKIFYDVYLELSETLPDWRSRCDLYNLYHLLNHLNLFGEGYLGQVRAVLQRYG